MTLVISMSRLCDLPIEEPSDIPQYVPSWEESFSKTTVISDQTKYGEPTESPCKGISNFLTTSKIAYFKRKYVEDEDLHPPAHTCCQRARTLAVPEDRAHILRLSLEKLRFIEDPEVFLRRSVLINNLLKRIRGEMQNDWYLSACSFGETPPHDWFGSQESTYRKRLRIAKEYDSSLHDCCFYQDCGNQYSMIPFSVYNGEGAPSSLPSCSRQSMDCSEVYGAHNAHPRIEVATSAVSDVYENIGKLYDKEINEEDQQQKESSTVKHTSSEKAIPLVCSDKVVDCNATGLKIDGMVPAESPLDSDILKQHVDDHKLRCVKETKLESSCFVMAGSNKLTSIAKSTCRVSDTY
ncbi:SERTA domain-containing protein 4 [Chiloscyllium plagiosum]|uniref:SERTA domain-containing protein 4 n=1 Tax=Chiloscyllium plagiosum TaxID=36176 RepID=UPI001CB86C40|nr:SERTA domain-containing protein 4 [Chiloscyllium plagiosum]XP_043551672.1 SERTA domain-containing protein 4 [Chiloscyllium plagiosum]XP_043551673.1 SERTA domain-containing protein 4 [Chiloscyllium plagiosum]XP_043551674.1 SERTA domain-containing protein 4 [Chiloscyllium plagiosum]XP_043551676.1 SERTA domain-containing protein 4 [Chiloscyllium plagiosum]XP_043551677.1 SERTA domain-containing protein 4 [Chiloscyllium plagiosum]